MCGHETMKEQGRSLKRAQEWAGRWVGWWAGGCACMCVSVRARACVCVCLVSPHRPSPRARRRPRLKQVPLLFSSHTSFSRPHPPSRTPLVPVQHASASSFAPLLVPQLSSDPRFLALTLRLQAPRGARRQWGRMTGRGVRPGALWRGTSRNSERQYVYKYLHVCTCVCVCVCVCVC